MVKVSIIIVNTNGKRFLEECLSSIYNSETIFNDFEVIMVDNNSIDGSVEYVKKNFPKVKIFLNKKNLGFAKSNNIGIKASSGDFIVLLNGDTVVTPYWLAHMINAAESDTKVGIVGPKTLKINSNTIDTTGHIFDHRFGDAINRGSNEIDKGQYDFDTDVFGVQFSCVLIKREVIDSVGLLDEKIFLYMEDVDYCLRARILGWKILYCPLSVIYHYGGGSTPMAKSWKVRKLGVTHRLRLVLKNYDTWNMLKWGIFGFAFCLKAIAASIKNRTWDLLLCYSYAFVWNLLNLPIKERIEVQRKRVVKDSDIFKINK